MRIERVKYLLPIRCIIFFLVFYVGASITKKNISEISNWWSIVASIVNIILVFTLVILCKKSNYSFMQLINYKKGETTVKQVVFVSIMIIMVGMAGMYLAGFIFYGVIPYAAPMMIAPIPAWLAILNIIVLPISTALAEDGLYLGCGVNQIKNKWLAIMIPAFFFALQHSFIPTLLDLRFVMYRFVSFLPLTIILCIYYHKKRNPLPIMIGHALIDVATVIQILLTSVIPGFFDMMCNM